MKIKKMKLSAYDYSSSLFGFLMFSSTMSFVFVLGIKIWYIALAICTLYFLKKRRLSIPHSIVWVLITLVLMSSVLNAFEFGIKRDFFNCILGFALICLAYSFIKNIGIEKTNSILEKVAILNAIAVLINTIIQKEAIKEYLYLRYLDHPVINTLSVGGTNIDATWLSIYCVVLYKSKFKWPCFLFSVVINTLYAARVGYLLNLFVLIIYLCFDGKKIYRFLIGGTALFAFSVPYLLQSNALEMALKRFSGIGTSADEGGMHRLIMWSSTPELIANYPLGVGIGNTIEALNKVTGRIHLDGNLHNLILEYFSVSGILGGIIYVSLLVWFAKYFIEHRRNWDSITLMLACYLVGGLVQFSGDESIMFLLVGSFIGIKTLENRKSGTFILGNNSNLLNKNIRTVEHI